jgi:hypothetical protein
MVSNSSPRGARPEAGAAGTGSRSLGHRCRTAVAISAVIAAAAVLAWRAGVFLPAGSPAPRRHPLPATAEVVRRDITATTPLAATLGYAGSYPVRGHGGTLTWLPSAGQVVRQGSALYRVDNGAPIVLLYGRVPDWRSLAGGDNGADVAQLNRDLVALGYANRAVISALGWSYYSWETTVGVARLRAALGVSGASGQLPLGTVVFAPQALRVSRLTGSLGGPADGLVLTATSDRHIVTVPLDVSRQGEIRVGDPVTVTLPDGTATPGTVSWVGSVASTSGSGASATIPVQVSITDPRTAGTLDEAPVTVSITTATAHHALVLPVTALVAQSTGRYAVEVIGPGPAHHWVPVTPGIFDDTSGLVQVTGALSPGQRVVVASS